MKIRTQADIAALEKLPAGERIRHKNVLEVVRDSAAAHADRVAFRFLSGTTPNDPARDVTYAEMLRRVIQTANLLQASQANKLVVERRIDPAMSEVFPWEQIPKAHMRMWKNEHKPGNMAVLVNAPITGLRTFEDVQEESRKRFG